MSITPGFRANRKFILIALRRPEDTPNTDYIANGATPLAMQTKGLSVEALVTEQITRDLDDGQTGGEHVINVGAMIKIGGMIELAGSGAAGTPVPNFGAFQLPAEFGQARTSLSLGGQTLNCISYEMSLNNTVEYTRGTELEEMYIDKWDEKGKFEIEKPSLSTFDPFALKLENVLTSYAFTHGVDAGEVFEMGSSDGLQVLDIQHGQYKGKSTYILDVGVIKGRDSSLRTA